MGRRRQCRPALGCTRSNSLPVSAGGVMRLSVALAGSIEGELTNHLLREDGQEDLCFSTWRPSTGRDRMTALLGHPLLPRPGDREVHGNVSFLLQYALRAAQAARQQGAGLAFMHSHPCGSGWQNLNDIDAQAETRIANLAREVTGLPLVGLTIAGDRSWSARIWSGTGRNVSPSHCESVRVVGDAFGVTFNDALIPLPRVSSTQIRTAHSWGDETQGQVSRLRIAVAGAGSVGLAIAECLARSGVQHLGIFDFDTIEYVNLDRLRGATRLDAALRRSKIHVARRLLDEASTAVTTRHEFHELSICEPEGFARLLDFDLIFCCVDRPWPRHVLNIIAFADLIPVIEGGIRVLRLPSGALRNAYWRSAIVRPDRPCLVCSGQYDPAAVHVERDGSLEDPTYIATLPKDSTLRTRENVSVFSMAASSSLLLQFASYVARPSGFGDPRPLRFDAREHIGRLDRVQHCIPDCPYPAMIGIGNKRPDATNRHLAAEQARRNRAATSLAVHGGQLIDDVLANGHRWFSAHFAHRGTQ